MTTAQNPSSERKEVARIFTKTDHRMDIRILNCEGEDVDYQQWIDSGQLKAFAVNMSKDLVLTVPKNSSNSFFSLNADIPFKRAMVFREIGDRIVGKGIATTVLQIQNQKIPLTIHYMYKAYKALYGSAMYIESVEYNGTKIDCSNKRLFPTVEIVLQQNKDGSYIILSPLQQL